MKIKKIVLRAFMGLLVVFCIGVGVTNSMKQAKALINDDELNQDGYLYKSYVMNAYIPYNQRLNYVTNGLYQVKDASNGELMRFGLDNYELPDGSEIEWRGYFYITFSKRFSDFTIAIYNDDALYDEDDAIVINYQLNGVASHWNLQSIYINPNEYFYGDEMKILYIMEYYGFSPSENTYIGDWDDLSDIPKWYEIWSQVMSITIETGGESFYLEGLEDGKNEVIDHPSRYNLYNRQQYLDYGESEKREGYQMGNDNMLKSTNWFVAIFTALSSIFNIAIFGDITLGAIVLIPFAVTFVWFIIKLLVFNKGD